MRNCFVFNAQMLYDRIRIVYEARLKVLVLLLTVTDPLGAP